MTKLLVKISSMEILNCVITFKKIIDWGWVFSCSLIFEGLRGFWGLCLWAPTANGAKSVVGGGAGVCIAVPHLKSFRFSPQEGPYLVCLKAGPTLVAMALLIGQIKELTQYWVSLTNQSKEDLSCGQAFKPPRQAQANSQLNQKYYN